MPKLITTVKVVYTHSNINTKDMQERLFVKVTTDHKTIPNKEVLLAQEGARADELHQAGILEECYIILGGKGAVLVFTETDEAKVAELLKTFPLYEYFLDIEYTLVGKSY